MHIDGNLPPIPVGSGKEEVTLNQKTGTLQRGNGVTTKIYYGGEDISKLPKEIRENVVKIVAKTLKMIGEKLDIGSLEKMTISKNRVKHEKAGEIKYEMLINNKIIKYFNVIFDLSSKQKTDKLDKSDKKETKEEIGDRDDFDAKQKNGGLVIKKLDEKENTQEINPPENKKSTNLSKSPFHVGSKKNKKSDESQKIVIKQIGKDQINAPSTNPSIANTNVFNKENETTNNKETGGVKITIEEEKNKKHDNTNKDFEDHTWDEEEFR